MKRKKLCMAVSLLMAGSMILGGCGGGGGTTPSSSAQSSATSSSAASSAASSEATPTEQPKAEPYAEGAGYEWMANNLPKLSEELVTFKLAAYQEVGQIDYNDMEFFKAMEKATNVHIEFECFPASSYKDQKNIMLTTGDYPDGFFGYMTMDMADINAYGPMGIFIPVDDLIDQYCPNYKAVLEKFPVMQGKTTSLEDGKKYSFGSINEAPARDYPDNLIINKTWLDNLGLQVPTTMEEYYEVLKAFKEKDANGNGDPNDEIPYTFLAINHINGYGSFFGAYGRAEAFNAAGAALNHFVVENGKVIYEPITEEWKTAVKELRKFVQEGLWDNEGFVQDGDQYNGKLTSATAIVGSAYTWSTGSFGENSDQYIPLAPLKATASSEPAKVHKRQNHISFQPAGLVITEKCEKPEILAQWIDLFYGETMSIMSAKGPQLVESITEDGVFSYDETPAADGTAWSTVASHEAPADGAPRCMTNEMGIGKVISKTVTPYAKADVIAEYYLNQPASVTLPGMQFTADEDQFVVDYGATIQKYVEGKLAEWMMGTSDIDKDWDAYMAQLQKSQIDKFIEVMQSAYDRTVGK